MENKDFFSMANVDANENYASFDNDMYADDWNADASFDDSVYANGAGLVTQTSKPYIIILTNTNTVTAASNVKFLDPATVLQSGVVNYGLGAGISASSGVAGTTYGDILYTFLTEPTLIGKTLVQSSTNAQVQSPISLTTRKATGSSTTDVLSPVINPYQQQTGIVELTDKFILNRFTSLTIGTVYAGATVTVWLYAQAEGNSAGAITGKSVNKYSAPQVSGLKVLGK